MVPNNLVGNKKIEEEVESDEGDGDNTIGANDKCLKKKPNSNSNKDGTENHHGLQFIC